jgi:hypothetical protein
MNAVEAGDKSHPLFLPMRDLDADQAHAWKCLVTQPHVTDLLEAEEVEDAGSDGV